MGHGVATGTEAWMIFSRIVFPVFLFRFFWRFRRLASCTSLAFILLISVDSWAGTGGSISGTVKDASSAVVQDGTVKAANIDTGILRQVTTNDSGFYSFPDLPIGRYNITIEKAGFKSYERTGITLDANSALIVDAVLEIAKQEQSVTVNENTAQVETSSTQMGEVIGSAKMTAVPLKRPQLYRSARSPAGRCSGRFDCRQHGVGCRRRSACALWRIEPWNDFDQRPAGVLQCLHGKRQRRGRGRQLRRGDRSQPRLHCRVPHPHQQLRCRVRRPQRRTDQRCYEIRHQPVAWRRIRIPAQHQPRCPQLFFSHARRV